MQRKKNYPKEAIIPFYLFWKDKLEMVTPFIPYEREGANKIFEQKKLDSKEIPSFSLLKRSVLYVVEHKT